MFLSPALQEKIDRWTTFIIHPLLMISMIGALFIPDIKLKIIPISFGIIVLCIIFAEYIETVWSYSRTNNNTRKRLLTTQLIVSGILGILANAAIYKHLGLWDGIAQRETHSAMDALYMAVIVASTVGFGDVVPTPEARPFAAAQALMSLVWTGLFFGVIVTGLFSQSNNNEQK